MLRLVVLCAVLAVGLCGKSKLTAEKCKKLEMVNCGEMKERMVCAMKNKVKSEYKNGCFRAQAMCKDNTLKVMRSCDPNATRPPKPQTLKGTRPPKVNVCDNLPNDCSAVQQKGKPRKFCDSEGNVYSNRCSFIKARCANANLKMGRCPKPTMSPEAFKAKMQAKCAEAMKKCENMPTKPAQLKKMRPVCLKNGTKFENRCAYMKAFCADMTIGRFQKCDN